MSLVLHISDRGSTGHNVKTCVHPVDGKRQATDPNVVLYLEYTAAF